MHNGKNNCLIDMNPRKKWKCCLVNVVKMMHTHMYPAQAARVD